MTVTIKNGNISDVQVQDYEDDATYMQSVIRELIPKVLKEQSTEVDTVSVRPTAAKGLLKAVDQAIYPEKQKTDRCHESDPAERPVTMREQPMAFAEKSK